MKQNTRIGLEKRPNCMETTSLLLKVKEENESPRANRLNKKDCRFFVPTVFSIANSSNFTSTPNYRRTQQSCRCFDMNIDLNAMPMGRDNGDGSISLSP